MPREMCSLLNRNKCKSSANTIMQCNRKKISTSCHHNAADRQRKVAPVSDGEKVYSVTVVTSPPTHVGSVCDSAWQWAVAALAPSSHQCRRAVTNVSRMTGRQLTTSSVSVIRCLCSCDTQTHRTVNMTRLQRQWKSARRDTNTVRWLQ